MLPKQHNVMLPRRSYCTLLLPPTAQLLKTRLSQKLHVTALTSMYVHTYACVYIRTYIRMYVRMYIHTFLPLQNHINNNTIRFKCFSEYMEADWQVWKPLEYRNSWIICIKLIETIHNQYAHTSTHTTHHQYMYYTTSVCTTQCQHVLHNVNTHFTTSTRTTYHQYVLKKINMYYATSVCTTRCQYVLHNVNMHCTLLTILNTRKHTYAHRVLRG